MNYPLSTASKFSTQYLMDYEIFHSSWWEKTLFLSLCKLQGLFSTFGWFFSCPLVTYIGQYSVEFFKGVTLCTAPEFSPEFPFVLSNNQL